MALPPLATSFLEATVFPWKTPKPLVVHDRGKFLKVCALLAAPRITQADRVLLSSLSHVTEVKHFTSKPEHKKALTLIAVYERTTLCADGIVGCGKDERSETEIVNDFQSLITGSCTIDTRTAEYLIPFMAFTKGSHILVPAASEHIRTAAWACNMMLQEERIQIDSAATTCQIMTK
jgi:RNA 3'-terminal phosphate cyclase